MANWNGSARSNYVRIKDIDGLEKSIEAFPVEISVHTASDPKELK